MLGSPAWSLSARSRFGLNAVAAVDVFFGALGGLVGWAWGDATAGNETRVSAPMRAMTSANARQRRLRGDMTFLSIRPGVQIALRGEGSKSFRGPRKCKRMG